MLYNVGGGRKALFKKVKKAFGVVFTKIILIATLNDDVLEYIFSEVLFQILILCHFIQY